MYAVSWITTLLTLNGVITIEMALLVVAILLVLAVDVAKKAGNRRQRSGHQCPPI